MDCLDPCSSDTTDCYVIDGNGYIVVSENKADTGTFFGTKEGAIMANMIEKKIFRKIPMFDYQAICFDVNHNPNSASFLFTVCFLFSINLIKEQNIYDKII